MIDVQEKKNKIIQFLETSGPSIPVRVAKAIQMDPVFASAILSELLSSKQIITSHMRIGSSPLYLLPTQKEKLEEHVENLKSAEKEAYLKLKQSKILTDENETPAIRVALRNIKDFAIPFKFQEKITWKYAFTPEEEIQKLLTPPKEKPSPTHDSQPKTQDTPQTQDSNAVPKAWEAKREEIKQAKEKSESPQNKDKNESQKTKKMENIFERKTPPTKEKTFLSKIEDFLETQNTKITTIEEVDKKKVIARIKSESQSALLFAFNKKKIDEPELMKCYKQAKKANLPYHIITLGEPTKKMEETIDAYKSLLKIDKLDN